jgi:hypothetical protein
MLPGGLSSIGFGRSNRAKGRWLRLLAGYRLAAGGTAPVWQWAPANWRRVGHCCQNRGPSSSAAAFPWVAWSSGIIQTGQSTLAAAGRAALTAPVS